VLRKLHPGDHAFKSNIDALVGKEARVLEAVDPSTDSGRVLVAGEDWRAVSATGEPITKGSSVTVVEIDGAKVVVVSEDSIQGG
jgi:membrane protein implicated in regulation of membrane protease activity